MSENNVIMFFDLCRLCLAKQGSVDIFDQVGLKSDISICTGIQLTLSDNLPRKVCLICWDIIKKAMELRLVATKNNYHLKSLFEDANDVCEVSLCEDMIDSLVQFEAITSKYSSEQVNTADSITRINSNEQGTSIITVRKDLFEIPQPELQPTDTEKKKKKHKEKKKSHKGEKTDREREEKRERKRKEKRERKIEEEKIKHRLEEIKEHRNEENKEQQTTDKNLECDTTETETKVLLADIKQFKSSQSQDAIVLACEVCSKQFETLKKLYLHRRLHNKTLACTHDSCHKMFATKGDLEKHIRTHTGEKPFECEICKKTFSQKVSLKSHVNSVHCKSEV